MTDPDSSTETTSVDDVRTLFGIMPSEIRGTSILAVCIGAGLAGMEFLAIFLIYPVFSFLTQPSTGDGSVALPFVGVTLSQESSRLMALLALGLMVLRSLLTYTYRRWWLGRTARAELLLSDRLLRAYAFAPYIYHLRTQTAALLSRTMTHVNIACQAGLVGVVGAASDVLLILGLGAALILINPVAGTVVSLYMLALGWIFIRLTRRSNKRLAQELEVRYSTVFTRVNTLLRGIRELTIFGVRENYLESISIAREQTVAANRKVMLLNDLPRVVLEVTLYVTILIALLFLLGLSNPESVLPLVALYVVAGLRIMPTLARLLSNISLGRTGSRMASSLATEIREIESPTGTSEQAIPIASYQADLKIQGVSFAYPGVEKPVLSDITLDIPFGTYCGFVGPSGSGKTTLIGLILGLFEPRQGTVMYGSDRVVSGDPYWYSKVAVLSQDVFLTGDSLRANIFAGLPADDTALGRAISQADLGELVQSLPNGAFTPIGEDGSRLSHGQRQRIGLARALYKHPEILILDEPTSALDAATEARIMSSIDALKGEMTIIAVSHRTRTLMGADLIISLSGGRVDQIGSPRTVLGHRE